MSSMNTFGGTYGYTYFHHALLRLPRDMSPYDDVEYGYSRKHCKYGHALGRE